MDMLRTSLRDMLVMIPAILIGFTFHEYAHAKMADMLGDKTARFQGRLNLNPLSHLDFIGIITILLIGFGWAKPVEINPTAFKNPKKDDLKVSLAGPFANLAVAIIATFLFGIYRKFIIYSIPNINLAIVLNDIFISILTINVMLFVFNLLPLPGFDGEHIVKYISPKFYYQTFTKLYNYRFIILIALIVPIGNSSIVGYIVRPIINFILSQMYKILTIFY